EICILESVVDHRDGIGSGKIQTRPLKVSERVGVEDQALEDRTHRADIFWPVLYGYDECAEMHILIWNRYRWKAPDVRELVAAKHHVLDSRSLPTRPNTHNDSMSCLTREGILLDQPKRRLQQNPARTVVQKLIVADYETRS
ncbi:MAG: hypothetical protein JWM43_450, partial [Acidobacteriaceae bacterium]|nr:hypothetical protein [Acidobacteriaceae bacterium]